MILSENPLSLHNTTRYLLTYVLLHTYVLVKSVISQKSLFSMESMASAFSLSWVMVFLRKVFTLFEVDKHLSPPAVVGVVVLMTKREIASEKIFYRLFSMNSWNRF